MSYQNIISMLVSLLPYIITSSNLTEMVTFIAEETFDPSQITLILWRRNDSVDVAELLLDYPGSVATASVQNKTQMSTPYLYNVIRVTQTIVIASTPEDFEYIAKIIKKDVVEPLKVILMLTTPSISESEISEATRAAWENNIGDILILTTDETENVYFWTYFPYGNGECENYKAMPLDEKTGFFFPRKFSNFYGCPIRVTLLNFLPYVILEKDNDTVKSIEGIDGEALNLVIEKLNATYDIVSSSDHGGIGTMVNGTATGSFGDLVNDLADIFAPAILLTQVRFPKVQFSYVYQTLDVYWCGPNRREIHAWAKVLLPFFTSITPFIILTFVVFIIVTKIIRRYALCQPARKRGIFFMTFIIFLGQEVKFETKCWIVNSLFVLWIWFCMVVRIGYQGDLVDGLQKVILEPPLGDLDDAINKLPGYGGVEVFSTYYKNTSKEEKFTIVKLGDVPVFIKDIAEGKRFLLVTDINLVKWFHQTLQVLEEPVTRAIVCLQMRAGWPAAVEANRILYTIAETGLFEKILDDFEYEWQKHSENEGPREAQPLNMATLGACFYGLLVLCGICFAIFCAELICHKCELKSKLKRKLKVK